MNSKRNKEIQTIKPEGEISTCPVCGYGDGFHVSFQLAENYTDGQIILICPDCHNRFKLGWPVKLENKVTN